MLEQDAYDWVMDASHHGTVDALQIDLYDATARGPVLERFCVETMADADIVALPTTPVATPRIADTDTGGDAQFVAVANRIGALLGPFNYLGLPALSLPIGLDAAGDMTVAHPQIQWLNVQQPIRHRQSARKSVEGNLAGVDLIGL